MTSQEVRQSPETKPRFFYGYIVVASAFFMMSVFAGTHFSFGVFFNPVLTEFGWTRAMTSGAFSLSWIIQGLLRIIIGRLNDKFGPRLVLALSGFVLGLGYLLMSQTSAVWQIYLFYGVIIGIGMAGTWIPLVSTVARWFVKRRTTMTGIVVAGVGTGILIATPVASWLISIYDWRSSYIIVGGIILVVAVLASQLQRRDPTQVGQRPYGENGGEGLSLGAKGFSLREAIHTRQLWIAFAMVFCFALCSFAITVHIVPHAIELGMSAASAATILATIGGVSIVGNIILGSVADKVGNRQVYIISFALTAAALCWLAPATEAWMLYLFAAVFGLAFGGCNAAQSPLVAALFGLHSHGLILGVVSFGYAIGGAVGPLLAGYIFDVTNGYQVAFLVCAAISVVGLILAALLTPTKTS